ncbi:GntR family transcriptional regulator [Caballeronia sp. GAWG2-1]|uniref:GntR family transcriptional regulator n=1 Tax=Caballeronia sp. GAWG2-1 TaxID=2921744 RepID=UPI002028491F
MFQTKLDQVAERLRERIISGEYRRGEKLKQAEIAEELGVSITPVREALRALEMEGFVLSVPHKGLLVLEIDCESAREIFELRVVLDSRLMESALENFTDGEIAELRTIHKGLAKLTKSRAPFPVRAANVRFHLRIYEIADRPQTLQFVRVLWAKYPFNFSDDRVVHCKQLLHEHDEIPRRLEAGDRAGALAAMIEHTNAGCYRGEENVTASAND